MKKVKRLLAFILAVVMVVGVLPMTEKTAQAATGDDPGRRIKLGKIVWSNDMETYHFSNVKATFTSDGAQKLFCLSVSNGGSFVIPDDFRFTGRRTVRAVQKTDSGFEYISLVRNGQEGEKIAGKELTTIMVTGNNITNEQVEEFIEGLTFKRNGVAADAVQEVSVVANQVDLDDSNMMAMASGGEVHYYDYVVFDEQQETWYDAYREAKGSTFSGLQGYLATITDQSEELYLYGSFKDMIPGDDIKAWVGGARTVTDHIEFDAATIADGALKPVNADGSIVTDWYWMCGPEAGKAFYRTNNEGNAYYDAEPLNEMYTDWNGGEPNNRHDQNLGYDEYNQEYALEYGYSAANWNDYSPYNISRTEWGMYGYIIEYSPYTPDSAITGKQNDPITEDVPSATGFREVRADKASDLDITVKNFIVSTDEAKSLTDTDAKTKADVTVTDGDDTITAGNTSINVDNNQLNKVKKGEKGEYDLTYTYTNDSDPDRTVSEDATVTVVDKAANGTANDGSGKKVEIGANHFSITIEQARDIEKNPNGSAQKQLIKELANAVALYDGEEVDPKNINITGNTIKAKKTDKDSPYKVTFEYKGQTVEVNVSVLDNGSEKTTVNLTANDFTVTAGQGNQLDTSEFIKKSAATATASNGSAVTITPDPSDLQALNNAIQNGPLGEYKVKVTATTNNGVSASTVVTVKVVEYPYIDANNFIISVEDTDKASANTIKKESDAGILTEGGKSESNSMTVPQDDVDKLKGVKEPGTVSGITLTDPNSPAGDRDVTATVVDETQKGWADNDSQTGAYVVIGANNFNLTIKQAQQIEADYTSDAAQDIIKTLANAVATNNGKAVDKVHITGNPGNIKAENGVYDVTFSYWGQTVTVKATVKDEGSADASNIPAGQVPDINLTANDFSIPAKSPVLGTTPEDTFKKMADVVAKHNDGSSVTDITPNAKQLEELAKAVEGGKKGEYPVTVTAKDEDGKTVTTTVTVTVTDQGGDSTGADITNPNPGDEHIGANNFIIGTDDFPLLTPENVIKLSDAEAYDIDTKADVPVTKVDISKVENKPGKYPITLSTDKGTSTTVYVTIDENWKTIGDVDKASDANKDKTSVDQDKAVPANKAGDKPSDTKGVDKTYELSNPKDVTQDLDSGREVDNVTLAGNTLPAGDYTASGSTLTIKSSALGNKPEGTYPVVINYKDGSKKTFNVIVVDKEVVDESNMSGDDLNDRDDLPLLLAKGIGGDKKISLSWLKYKGAEGYEVYWSYCNGKKVYKKVTSTTAKVRKATHKKLSYKKSYKYFVIAYKIVDGKKVYIAKSPQIHVAMKKDKRTNAKKVTVKKSKVTLKPGKTSVIKASMTRESSKKKLLQHAAKFRYYTDDYRVATVNKKGKIKAVAAGKCNIYVIANNGVYKKVKVTVKK
ncbi:MAG: Ig-like domain-containing protein [Lachnospiraceae bacterium]|nr:Ig-like domain-containing protein [Lachnospiraceae bacterium]